MPYLGNLEIRRWFSNRICSVVGCHSDPVIAYEVTGAKVVLIALCKDHQKYENNFPMVLKLEEITLEDAGKLNEIISIMNS